MPHINYSAVLVAAIAAMILGYLWYGPFFGKIWMQGMGWDPSNREAMAKMKKSAPPAYAQMFVGSLITAYCLAFVIWAFAVAMPSGAAFPAGLQAGFFTWLGFVLPVKYGDKLWGGKKFKFVSIDLGYYLVNLMIMGVILSVWK